MHSDCPHATEGRYSICDAFGGFAGRPNSREFVPGYEAISVFGIGAPKNTPIEIVEKLNREINAALADSKVRARLADMGGRALAGSPADFGKLIAEETEKRGKVVKFSGAKPD